MPTTRIAVIGGVAAGTAAAAEARRTDSEADIVLFEKRQHISYGACEMPYYVAGWIEDAEKLLVYTPREFEQKKGVTVRTGQEVVELAPEEGRLVVRDTETDETRVERFDRFIVSTGAEARLPEGCGPETPNLFALRRLQDALGIRQHLKRWDVEEAVILGGGSVGVEMAEALVEVGARVTIVEPSEGLLTDYLDLPLREHVRLVMQENGVEIVRDAAVRVATDEEGAAVAVETEGGQRLACDLVIAAMGIAPNTSLAEAAGAPTGASGALAVDDAMATGVANLWACGDCVEVRRIMDDARIYLPLSPVAFRTGHVAGRNAAGAEKKARFGGVCVSSTLQVFGLEVASVGFRLDEAREAGFDAFDVVVEASSRVRIYPGSKPLYVRLVAERGTGRLLGGELVGHEGAALRANVLVPLIREGRTVADLRDLDLVYSPPLAPAIDPLIRAAFRATQEV